jgi:FkbM family methyltransferase
LLQYATVFSDFQSIQNWRALRNGTLASGRPGGLVRLRPRATGGNRLYCRPGTRDADVFQEVFFGQSHLPPGDLRPVRNIIDLGSNIGLTVAHYASLYPEARILGIELDAGNFELCVKNVAPYGDRCSLVWGAVWVEDGEIGYTGTSEWAFHVAPNGGGSRGTVKAHRMESLMRSFGMPVIDFIKMDIEGAEQELLAEAGAWIGRVRCLKIEIHHPYTTAACIEQLARYGLECEPLRQGVDYVIARNRNAGLRASRAS